MNKDCSASTLVNSLEKETNISSMEPCAIVVMGAHGDLTKRKLLPALYALYTQDLLPKDFCIVGISRTVMDHEQFRVSMQEAIHKYGNDIPFEQKSWDSFAAKLYYQASNFDKEHGLSSLVGLLADAESKHGTKGNNIFYMATPPSLYNDIIDRLSESGLAKRHSGLKAPWPRIVVEKPFGRDLNSAVELDKRLHKVFSEEQIFRIDHYLGKETVQNIMVLRFANGIFEPLWNRQHVDHIQITNAETIGVEGRAAYYEEAGNLRDMIQNHMLQLVALVAMEPPAALDAQSIRDEKHKVLKALRPIDPKTLDDFAVRGQYDAGEINGEKVIAYRQEARVSPNSCIETFSALKLYIDNWRWADVPFYVRSGKRLAKSVTEIAIHFKKAPHRLFSVAGVDCADSIGPNILVLQIQPNEGISLKFATKKPGPTTQLKWLSMDFGYGSAFGARSPSAYERLVHDCIIGDASLFARTDAVQTSWAFISPILSAWSGNSCGNFPNYQAGSWGPKESEKLIEQDGRDWRVI
jgi:glucose-6-phosphate 1-dehydrogenase